MSNGGYIEDKELYFLTVILSIIFVYQLIKISSMIHYFPLNGFLDGLSYMTRLYFLAEYGYHNFVPNWHEGFFILKHYAPGWFFFTLPIYWLTKNIVLSSFISMLLSYILGLIFFLILRKSQKLSLAKSLAFFLIFYLSPSAFSDFFFLGRLTDLFSFVFLILGFALIYKKREWDSYWIFLFFSLYTLMLLNQSSVVILYSFLVLGLLLTLGLKERILIITSIIISLILTSFWWIPFLDNKGTILENFKAIGFNNYFSYGTIISMIFLISFFFFWISKNRNKRDLLFYSPSLILVFLYATRIVSLIPLLNNIWANSYNLFFTFLAIFFIFKTNFNLKVKKFVVFGIYLIPLFVIVISFIYPIKSFEYNETQRGIISLFPNTTNRVLIVPSEKVDVSGKALIAYGTIYYNLTTPDGWQTSSVSPELYQKLKFVQKTVSERNCNEIESKLEELKVEQVFAIGDKCQIFLDCGFKISMENEDACLIKI